jgi:hypothetical protein
MFDAITAEKLAFYVYALIDPSTDQIFYIGKGKGNRVFDHVSGDLEQASGLMSEKQDQISRIKRSNKAVKHVIIRHGLKESEAFLLESVLIDFSNRFGSVLSNEVSGHDSGFFGMKSTDELIRQYNAPPLESLKHAAVIININRRYASAKGSGDSIYEATKQAWVISEARIKTLEYALAEFQGVIIGVYKIHRWYRVKTQNNIKNNRWGFDGEEAAEEVQKLYKNKSIAHVKKKGAANPIRYSI